MFYAGVPFIWLAQETCLSPVSPELVQITFQYSRILSFWSSIPNSPFPEDTCSCVSLDDILDSLSWMISEFGTRVMESTAIESEVISIWDFFFTTKTSSPSPFSRVKKSDTDCRCLISLSFKLKNWHWWTKSLQKVPGFQKYWHKIQHSSRIKISPTGADLKVSVSLKVPGLCESSTGYK